MMYTLIMDKTIIIIPAFRKWLPIMGRICAPKGTASDLSFKWKYKASWFARYRILDKFEVATECVLLGENLFFFFFLNHSFKNLDGHTVGN